MYAKWWNNQAKYDKIVRDWYDFYIFFSCREDKQILIKIHSNKFWVNMSQVIE